MGFKDDVRELGADLERRVTNLESAVRAIQGRSSATTVETPLPTRTPGATLGVDYGAVAFGLSEIKRKVGAALAGRQFSAEYEGAVQYFADVFAKSDPGFNEAEFKRQAGV